MPIKRSNRGQQIDMDALIAAGKSIPAVGNMKVNAGGDILDQGGKVVKKNEERVREYYKKNPSSSVEGVSLKGEMPKLQPDSAEPAARPKTARTAKENVRTADPEPQVSDTVNEILNDAEAVQAEPLPEEPAEFDPPESIEPVGYKEVELPNGDIEMVPVYKQEEE